MKSLFSSIKKLFAKHPDDKWEFIGTSGYMGRSSVVPVSIYVNHHRKKAEVRGSLSTCSIDYEALMRMGKVIATSPFLG